MLRTLRIPVLFCGAFGLICLTYRGMAFQSISPLLGVVLALCIFRLIRVTQRSARRDCEMRALGQSLAATGREAMALNIKNLELAASNQELTKLHQSLQQLLDEVSHDFRTPLSVIKGYSEIMHEGMAGELSAEQLGFNRMIIDRTRDLAQMVDDMHDTSKSRSGSLHAERVQCDVAAIFGGLQPIIRDRALAAGIRWSEEIDQGLPFVFADREKAIRVLTNLTLHAIKRCPDGGSITVAAKTQNENEVKFSVKDGGPTIPPDKLKSIRNEFYSVRARPDSKGPGLDLEAANELVRLNGGTMTVTSEPQYGTVFCFTLPVKRPVVALCQ